MKKVFYLREKSEICLSADLLRGTCMMHVARCISIWCICSPWVNDFVFFFIY